MSLERRPLHLLAGTGRNRAVSVAALHRYSRFVRMARQALPLLAVLLLALVVTWPQLRSSQDPVRYSFRPTSGSSDQLARVTEPVYQALDFTLRPYTVTADSAQQKGQDSQVALVNPRADLLQRDGHWIYAEAETGQYDRTAERLTLSGAVTLYHDDGTMARTATALLELAGSMASGLDPVEVQGSFGTIKGATGFTVHRVNEAMTVFIRGPAHAVLEQARQ